MSEHGKVLRNPKKLMNNSLIDMLYDEYDQHTGTDQDIFRWTGKVIDNDDPEQYGRVRIMIIGKYEDIPEEAIPWAIPDVSFVGGSNGSFIVPEIDTYVRGYFDQGDIHKPVYDSIAFSTAPYDPMNFENVIEREEDYPNKIVFFETNQKDYLTLNKSSGELLFMHRSGFNITVDADGTLNINTGASLDKSGDIIINCEGNVDMTVTGNVTVTAENGDINIDSTNGFVNLGGNLAKQLVNNLPKCLLTGAPHCIGNNNVMA